MESRLAGSKRRSGKTFLFSEHSQSIKVAMTTGKMARNRGFAPRLRDRNLFRLNERFDGTEAGRDTFRKEQQIRHP
ncbi:MAG: hypothetical protein J6Y56_04415 [Fibrobacterales bacterium]|nr:hypothetical protein [Fibrobacterales bacterium]